MLLLMNSGEVRVGGERSAWIEGEIVIPLVVPGNDNVTALLYRRRSATTIPGGAAANRSRNMAFDPLLVFTAVLVVGAVISQVIFILALEF